jgi:hypothetical protein
MIFSLITKFIAAWYTCLAVRQVTACYRFVDLYFRHLSANMEKYPPFNRHHLTYA